MFVIVSNDTLFNGLLHPNKIRWEEFVGGALQAVLYRNRQDANEALANLCMISPNDQDLLNAYIEDIRELA